MKEFTSLLEAGVYLGTVVARRVEEQHGALDRAAKIVQTEAKAIIGNYQEGAGPFVPWAELADATKDDRVRQGFSENEPLLRTGGLRDRIERLVLDGETAIVGSNEDAAVYQELGTARIPPRSFLGIAGVHKTEEVARVLGEGVVEALVGRNVFGGALKLP